MNYLVDRASPLQYFYKHLVADNLPIKAELPLLFFNKNEYSNLVVTLIYNHVHSTLSQATLTLSLCISYAQYTRLMIHITIAHLDEILR